MGKREGALGPATLERDRNLFAIPHMSSGSLPEKVVGSGVVVQTCTTAPKPITFSGSELELMRGATNWFRSRVSVAGPKDLEGNLAFAHMRSWKMETLLKRM